MIADFGDAGDLPAEVTSMAELETGRSFPSLESALTCTAMSRSKPVGFVRAVARYYRDPSASVLGKLLAVLAIVYVVCPIDLIPDVPIVGWLDDLGVMGLATAWLARRVATYRVLPQGENDGGGDPVSARKHRPFSVSP